MLRRANNQLSDKTVVQAAYSIITVLNLGECVDDGAIVVGIEGYRVFVHYPCIQHAEAAEHKLVMEEHFNSVATIYE